MTEGWNHASPSIGRFPSACLKLVLAGGSMKRSITPNVDSGASSHGWPVTTDGNANGSSPTGKSGLRFGVVEGSVLVSRMERNLAQSFDVIGENNDMLLSCEMLGWGDTKLWWGIKVSCGVDKGLVNICGWVVSVTWSCPVQVVWVLDARCTWMTGEDVPSLFVISWHGVAGREGCIRAQERQISLAVNN